MAHSAELRATKQTTFRIPTFPVWRSEVCLTISSKMSGDSGSEEFYDADDQTPVRLQM